MLLLLLLLQFTMHRDAKIGPGMVRRLVVEEGNRVGAEFVLLASAMVDDVTLFVSYPDFPRRMPEAKRLGR
jgi:hypothetical protein